MKDFAVERYREEMKASSDRLLAALRREHPRILKFLEKGTRNEK